MSRAILAAAALAGAACAQPAAVAPVPTTTVAPRDPHPPSTTVAPPNPHPPSTTTAPTTTSTPPVSSPPAVAEGTPEGMAGAAEQEATLACIRHWESRGNYRAVSRSGKYRGAHQWDRRTWNGVAARHRPDLVGVDPAAASPADQDEMAGYLLAERGLQPWPTLARRCG